MPRASSVPGFLLSTFLCGAAVAEVSPPPGDTSPRPGQVFRDCPDCPQMTAIPGGTFMMGLTAGDIHSSPREVPQHAVAVAPFALGTYDVTRGEFAAFAREVGHRTKGGCYAYNAAKKEFDEEPGLDWSRPGFEQTDRHPAVCVSWDEAKDYAAWLSRKTGKAYRLPSEAEFEYSARAGATTRMYWGEEYEDACRHANGADLSAKQTWNPSSSWPVPCNDGHAFTAPVGSYAANRFGLFDMIGNVWRWTEDCWHESHVGAPADGRARLSDNCAARVLRGASWASAPLELRSAFRIGAVQHWRDARVGFRLARSF